MKVYILRSNNPKDVINMIYINKENADANCKELNKISSDWYVEERETIDEIESSFDFLLNEPDIYNSSDGEPV